MTIAIPVQQPTTVADLLNAAAARIETEGWHRNTNCPSGVADPFTAPCCADAALWLSAGVDPQIGSDDENDPRLRLIYEAETALAHHLNPSGPASILGAIALWNDREAENAKAVVTKLRRVAAVLIEDR